MKLVQQLLLTLLFALAAQATEPPTSGQKVTPGSDTGSLEDLDAVGHGQIDRKYDFKQSFKKPFFIVKETNDRKIPFFEVKDNAIASNEFVRLTSSLPNQVGSIWAEAPNQHKEWQLHFTFRASGRGYAGGDGMALWYSKEKGVTGTVMGSKDKWNGLGIILSTSSHKENRFTPFIYAMENDGTKAVEGRTPQNHEILGNCLRDYRNTPHPVWVRVTYKNRQLRVDFDLYKDGYQFVECFRAKNVDLPTGYYFGVSASTGLQVHDDHDVLGLEVFEVHPHPRKSKSKFQDEYKLNANAQKAIDEAKKAVDEVTQDLREAGVLKEEEQEAAFNPQMIQNLQENQFKIIEALNQIKQKVNNAPQAASENSHQKASEGVRNAVDPVDKKVDGIKTKINELELKLDALDRDIKELFNVIRNGNSMGQMKLSEVSKKLDESHIKIKSAQDAIQSGAGASVYAVSVIVRMRGDRAPKKYI
ncbi:legume-like lectin family-domain-containing protein [Obelidium mucronatum]|nr:legume-like lectin family-domain-containing protein [Obelidium mucronatum]